MSAPASPTLRRIAALLLLVAAALAIALPFVSSTLLTIALGGVAIAAGVSQLLRLSGAEGGRRSCSGACRGPFTCWGGSACWRSRCRAPSA